MKLDLIKAEKTLHKAYLKQKPVRAEIDLLKSNLTVLFTNSSRANDEEHLKSQITYFLRDTWYRDQYQINPIAKADLAIHNGNTSNDSIAVILEVKNRSNRSEMISDDRPNTKALHELILYYFRERATRGNNELKHLIATNAEVWYIFDANEFDKKIYRNTAIRKLYDVKENDNKDNPFFYEELARILEASDISLQACKLRLTDNAEGHDRKLGILNKVLSPTNLLKLPVKKENNHLDTAFYEELLHILGLEETKSGSKKLITRMASPNPASLLENTIIKLLDHDALIKIKGLQQFGDNSDTQIFSIALELCITWVNRILFSKLLEAQLFSYAKSDKAFLFLDTHTLPTFEDLNTLFFQVLAEAPQKRHAHLSKKFAKVPYLNSSLFERTNLETETIEISNLDTGLELTYFEHTILTDARGKRRTGKIKTIDYFFEFLDAYDFSSDANQEVQETRKRLINASVLGLIFEKINGYKDGSYFTPGSVTTTMCDRAIRQSILRKFNETKGWNCQNINDLYNEIRDKNEANKIINSLLICDPAVGSGHFLVSALNELIAVKSELHILQDASGRNIRDYTVEIVDDELVITDEDGNIFQYHPHNKESQRVQETFFHEKETLIEKCLFGVDINPNSVKICRLRLWIELLKHSYYTSESNFTDLETLPNIDINIKCGNSLISRFSLDTPIKAALKNNQWTIEQYKDAVFKYQTAQTKSEKREMEGFIGRVKADFRSHISPNDKKFKQLNKLRGDLQKTTNYQELFKETKQDKDKINKLKQAIATLEKEILDIRNNKIYEQGFEWRFEFPEVLNDLGDFQGFDVVLGNPPYGVKFDNDEKAYIKENFSSYQYKFESFIYFIEKGLEVLKPGGILEFITPTIWLTLENCRPIRKICMEDNDLKEVEIYGEGVFDEAIVNTCTFQVIKQAPASQLRIAHNNRDFVVDKAEWVEPDNLAIEYRLTPETMAIVKKIRERSEKISAFGSVIQGITPYDAYQGQSKEIIKTRAYHFEKKNDDTCGKWLEGTDVTRYDINWSGTWLSYGDWLAAPREKKYFTGDRLLFREVPGPNKRIQATLATSLYYYGHSISPFKAGDEYIDKLPYLLAVANSRLISWYGRYTLPNFGKDVFPKLNPNDIKELPIPKGFDKEKEITDLATRILEQKKESAGSDTATYEAAIDKALYTIYELTEAEIRIVEET